MGAEQSSKLPLPKIYWCEIQRFLSRLPAPVANYLDGYSDLCDLTKLVRSILESPAREEHLEALAGLTVEIQRIQHRINDGRDYEFLDVSALTNLTRRTSKLLALVEAAGTA